MFRKLFVIVSLLILASFTYLQFKKEDSPKIINPSKELTVVETAQKVQPSIGIDHLRSLKIDSEAPIIEQELGDGSKYKKYVASYISDGNKIFGLLTVPNIERPEGGFSAVVFIHGYIPPSLYKTTEKYVAYVDYLAKNNFVVFKIDLRGNGESEGTPTGSYFSPGYTIDAINAVKSLQKLDYVNGKKIGMWGHSMSGNAVFRSLLVSDQIDAAVIWAGAVYSYEDFAKYRLNDGSYVRRAPDPHYDARDLNSQNSEEVRMLRENPENVDFSDDFWTAVSLTKNIKYLQSPVQIHHARNDLVVNIGYSKDLAKVLLESKIKYELFEYDGGGHNIDSPYFEQAMQRTVNFFNENLK